ncbi:MAG TPA: 30S ribosomal protein S6 [Syntrophomonadaceae bacterium]|nr:30S ribosomal protein S6 [Syntrophomonadaceae bacterium]
MRTYEIMFIFKPDLAEEEINESKERLQQIITDFGGEFVSEAEGWGKKRLAYSIKDYTEGIYYLWYFNGEPETVKELDRIIKLSDKFLRHIIIRQEDK